MTGKQRELSLYVAAGAVIVALSIPGAIPVVAQNRKDFSIVAENNGHVALGLAIRKLNVAGTFLQAPAHPDDETNALFALFGYGRGLRVIDLQNNRGEGGQNESVPSSSGTWAYSARRSY